jgi:hypothetical protein
MSQQITNTEYEERVQAYVDQGVVDAQLMQESK